MSFSTSAWSNQGLIAHFPENSSQISIIDPIVGFNDPFYCQKLKVQGKAITRLQWNSNGSHLLAISKFGSIEIFRQQIGLTNQWESYYYKEESNNKDKILCCIWCENRRIFSFNPNSSPQQQQSNFYSKSFVSNFAPVGLLSFCTISTEGTIEIFTETEDALNGSKFICTKVQAPNQINTTSFDDAFAYQKANGKVLIVLQSSCEASFYELENCQKTGFNLQFISKSPALSVSPSKFIWSDSKDVLIQLELIEKRSMKLSHFNCQNFSLISTKILEIPFEIQEFFHTSRTANYIFLQSNEKFENVLILNLNGEIVKNLTLEPSDFSRAREFEFNDVSFRSELNDNSSDNSSDDFLNSSLLISPNGLIVSKIAQSKEEGPTLLISPIGEINSKNIVMIREFLGKLISSSLNNFDSWDIFQLINRTVQKLSSSCNEHQQEAYSFISTLLAEWISLLETSSLSSKVFYSKLLDLFKILPYEFIDAYNLVNLSVNLFSIEKILLSNVTFPNQQEDYFGAEWITSKLEVDQITIDPEALVSLLPVLEEALTILHDLSEQCEGNEPNVFALIPLDDEIFKTITLIWTVSQAVEQQFKSKSKQNNQILANFYEKAFKALQTKSLKLQEYINFLGSLRTDPQIQPKCPKNLFLFLTEFLLDTTNLKKIYGQVKRIFSRFALNSDPLDIGVDMNSSSLSFFDDVKCLNLPIKSASSVLICRKCSRTSTFSTKTHKSRREIIFSASWHNSLWKTRCPCGSSRRILNFKS